MKCNDCPTTWTKCQPKCGNYGWRVGISSIPLPYPSCSVDFRVRWCLSLFLLFCDCAVHYGVPFQFCFASFAVSCVVSCILSLIFLLLLSLRGEGQWRAQKNQASRDRRSRREREESEKQSFECRTECSHQTTKKKGQTCHFRLERGASKWRKSYERTPDRKTNFNDRI